MGRTPDHVAGFLAGYGAKSSIFAEHNNQFADNVVQKPLPWSNAA